MGMTHNTKTRHALRSLVAVLLCLLLAACSNKTPPAFLQTAEQPQASAPEATPTQEPAATEPLEQVEPEALPDEPAEPEVSDPDPTDTAPTSTAPFDGELTGATAYYFTDLNGVSYYYGAFEYRNNSADNAVVSSIDVTLTFGSKTVTQTFTPPSAALDTIAPNGISTAALWIQTTDKAPEEGAETTATATVHLVPTETVCTRPMTATNIQVIQNYPLFATASGCMVNLSDTTDCTLAIMYLSFYDESGALLGVTNFTKNLAVPAHEERDFVVHLMSLPIPALAENTATVVGRGFGVS